MNKAHYKTLVEMLDAAEHNGHVDELLTMTPEEILRDMYDSTGHRHIPKMTADAYKVIARWQTEKRAK